MTSANGSERHGHDTSFRSALRRLDAAGRLVKVQSPVDLDLQVAGIMKRNDGDRALLFEKVTGASMPVLGNFLASTANCETALALDRAGIRRLMLGALGSPLPPVTVEDGPAQEVIHRTNLNLAQMLPVLRHAPCDTGRFITGGVVLACDPQTGVYNASYHRLQLIGPDRTAIKLDYGRHLLGMFDKAQRRGQPLPIAVCLGTDLSLMFTAAFMGSQMPADADEIDAAGAMRGEPLTTLRCVSQPLSVPADTEIVIEGHVLPDETVHEGPFAEFLGYQSEDGPAPVVEVTAITHRARPVYHAINGAGRETIMLRKYVLEVAALKAMQDAVPIVTDVELPAGGLHRFHLIIGVKKSAPQHDGLQRNAIIVAFGALKDLNLVVAVDDDIDVHDLSDVEYAIATRMNAGTDLMVLPGARGHEYVRVSDEGVAAKLGIDATVPFEEQNRFLRTPFLDVALREMETSSDPATAYIEWLC